MSTEWQGDAAPQTDDTEIDVLRKLARIIYDASSGDTPLAGEAE